MNCTHYFRVHCILCISRDGTEKSGLFCVLYALLARTVVEHDVAIAQIIQEMRNRRENVIPNVVSWPTNLLIFYSPRETIFVRSVFTIFFRFSKIKHFDVINYQRNLLLCRISVRLSLSLRLFVRMLVHSSLCMSVTVIPPRVFFCSSHYYYVAIVNDILSIDKAW